MLRSSPDGLELFFQESRGVIADFVERCEENHLLLNTSKTKRGVVDFRRTSTPRGTCRVGTLGQWTLSKLAWSLNTDHLKKKPLYLLRRLRSLGASKAPLRNFCDTVLASAVSGHRVLCGKQHRRRPKET